MSLAMAWSDAARAAAAEARAAHAKGLAEHLNARGASATGGASSHYTEGSSAFVHAPTTSVLHVHEGLRAQGFEPHGTPRQQAAGKAWKHPNGTVARVVGKGTFQNGATTTEFKSPRGLSRDEFDDEDGIALDRKRSDMPQIPAGKLVDFADYMRARGVTASNETVPVESLKSSQADLNKAKVGRLKEQGLEALLGGPPLIVAGDHEVLDGHHRAAAIGELDPKASVSTLSLGCSIEDAIDHASAYPHAVRRGIRDGSVKFSLDVIGMGLGPFRLDQAAPRRFTKDVLRVGTWIHPTTGQRISFDRAALEDLARDTNEWEAIGHKVYFPDGHTSSARSNLGTWSNFRVQGDTLQADVDVADADAASKVGKTITDVSPQIEPNALSSTGRRFKSVIVHVAATPEPVVPAQGNFVRLSRLASDGSVTGLGEKNVNKEKPMSSKLLSLASKLLNLPDNSDEDTVCAALGKAKLSTLDDEIKDQLEDEADKKQGEMMSKLSRDLAERDTRIKALEDDRARRLKKGAEEKVQLARHRSVELGTPIEDDVAKDALSLLSSESEESQRHGDRILSLALGRATAKPIYGQTLTNPGKKLEDKKKPNPILLSMGYQAQKDEKGEIQGYTRSR